MQLRGARKVKAAGIAERSGKNWSASAECGVAHKRANEKPHEKILAYKTSIGNELSTTFPPALLLLLPVGSSRKILPVVNTAENECKRDEQCASRANKVWFRVQS
jgi:hypothetical protein